MTQSRIEFEKILSATLADCGIGITDDTLKKFGVYYELLEEYNKSVNLTALTSPEDAAVKNFADSLTLLKLDIPQNASVIDIGTGAGFPGMALKIARPDLRVTLLDSLNKRLVFLDKVCDETGFTDVTLIHARAEEAAREAELRESFDIAVSRAVAKLSTLAEYCIPFVNIGGRFIAMKGKGYEEELDDGMNAVNTLGAELADTLTFSLGDAGERALLSFAKVRPTDEKYPRTAKKIKNSPL